MKITNFIFNLKLTEGIIMDHIHIIDKMRELRKLSVELSPDDFATGY